MARVLVAGGAGFVGSHLCDALIARGHQVLCLDNLHTGSETNIRHLGTDAEFEFARHDVVNRIEREGGTYRTNPPPFSPSFSPMQSMAITIE